MMTEEKVEKLTEEVESAAETENSAAVSDESLVEAAEVEQSDTETSKVSNFAESDSQESAEISENSADEKVDESAEVVEHADEKKSESKKPENFNGISESAITTVDNPFDPLQNFDDWFRFDEEKGYHTCAYLSRIAEISDEMSDEEVLQEIERAIDEIVRYDFRNIYKKVKRPSDDE